MRSAALAWSHRLLRPGDIALAALVVVTAGFVIARAASIDTYWDTLAYHLPFAARAAGLCDARCFGFDPGAELRYAGFPIAMHRLYGWIWRLTGTPVAIHIVPIASVAALIAYLRWRFRVPVAWTWIALLAIPLVQIHLTSSYVDLPANALLTIAVLAIIRLCDPHAAPIAADIGIAWAALALAAGSKLQLIPVALALWLAVIGVLAIVRRRADGRVHWAALLGIAVLGIATITPQLVANASRHGNPFFPISMRVAGIDFVGVEKFSDIQVTQSVSTKWLSRPAPLRWLASVMEYDALQGRATPWTIDQGDVPQSSPAFRMGGYFGAYVIALLAIVAVRRREVRARPAIGAVVALGVACAFLPASHELRYYMTWMMSLACVALMLAFAPQLRSPLQPVMRTITKTAVVGALISVVSMTGAHYLRPDRHSLASLVEPTDRVLASMPATTTLCIADRDRHALFYTGAFHAGSTPGVRSIWGREAPGCDRVIEVR